MLDIVNLNSFYAFIVTDKDKEVLETGVTGSLIEELQRRENKNENKYLLYWESFSDALQAISREHEIKKMSKKKKEKLIHLANPNLQFLNEEVYKASYSVFISNRVLIKGKGEESAN